MTTGLLGHIGLKQEAAFGEEASPPTAFGEIYSETVSMDNNFIKTDIAAGSRFISNAPPGRITASGDVSMYLTPEGILPLILKGVLGQAQSEEITAGVYQHVFSPLQASRLPSFTVQADHEALCQNWVGCSFSKLLFSAAPNGFLEAVLSILAQRPAETLPAAPSYSELKPLTAHNVVFTLNGDSNLNFEKFTISFSNKLEPVWTMSGKRWASCHAARGFSMEGSITLEFDSESEMRRVWGSSSANGPKGAIEPGSLNVTKPVIRN